MKKITIFTWALLLAGIVSAQTNWTLNGSTWEKDVTPGVFKFSEQTTAQVQANILSSAGGANPNPAITSTSGQDLTNGYFVVSGANVTAANTADVKSGFNVRTETLDGSAYNVLRLATTNSSIPDDGGTKIKSPAGAFLQLNWYVPSKYDYTGYFLRFDCEFYTNGANNNQFYVYNENSNELMPSKTLNQAGWNSATFTQTETDKIPFRIKLAVPNNVASPNGVINYYKQPKFTLTSATEPATLTITVTDNGNGATSAQYPIVRDQDVQVFTFTPGVGENLVSVVFDGVDVTSEVVANKFATPLLKADKTMVVTYSDTPTGLNNAVSNFSLVTKNNVLSISGLNGSEHVAVYSVSGQRVFHETCSASSVTINLPKGIYIVKVGEQSEKIVM